MAEPWKTPDLVLGWKVTKGLEPQHWDNPDAKPGDHSLTNVVTSEPKTIACHTVIVAQSGSGKSFFLGRVLEEILLKTRSRVVILDPNSDFRKIAHAKPAEWWTDPDKYRYKRSEGKGFLADEPTQADFLSGWTKSTKIVYSRRIEEDEKPPAQPAPAATALDKPKFAELLLDWLKLPVELLLEEAADERRDELRHCHSLVYILAQLAAATNNKEWLEDGQFLTKAQVFCDNTSPKDEEKTVALLKETFGSVKATNAPVKYGTENVIRDRNGRLFVELPEQFPTLSGVFLKQKEVPIEDFAPIYGRAATYRNFVQDEAKRFYFARAFEIQKSGLIAPRIRDSFAPDPNRVQVVDLPSVPDARHQKMVMSTFVESEWVYARKEWEKALGKPAEEDTRVPTFIVVEEAHNVIPADAETLAEKKLQEQFRRIAAEGRKYGLFLILVSQRPDKLDRMVMSECENRAVMKVGSSLVLRTTCEVLGLESVIPRMTEKILDFDIGRALLAGPWVGGEPTFLVSAARRSEEGGRNLRWQYWAQRAP
jgi:hypothetical protein